MKNKFNFLSENILLSVTGHLLVVVLVIVTLSVVVFPDRIVAPDRVQIFELDLANVRITRDETLVYNTAPPKPEPPKKEVPKPEPKKQEQVEDWQAPPKPEVPKPEPEKKPEPPKPEPAPVQTTVVRVNRDTASLNRTMTVSVIDALRMAMTRCWQFDRNRPGIDDLRVVAHLTMAENGMVRDMWFEGIARADTDPAFAYIVETIRMAVSNCQPFRMLPASEFDLWKNVQFTFYPSTATVQ
ncbi:MAG: hypothetical protein FWE52_00465 [Alphaproteobacteria bacterium]|nr:hypothetical protein [Alphaproteobacteria bacterium]